MATWLAGLAQGMLQQLDLFKVTPGQPSQPQIRPNEKAGRLPRGGCPFRPLLIPVVASECHLEAHQAKGEGNISQPDLQTQAEVLAFSLSCPKSDLVGEPQFNQANRRRGMGEPRKWVHSTSHQAVSTTWGC